MYKTLGISKVTFDMYVPFVFERNDPKIELLKTIRTDKLDNDN